MRDRSNNQEQDREIQDREMRSLFRQLSLIKNLSISWPVDYALVAFLGQARIQAASSHKRRNAMTSLIMSNHNY